MSKANKIGSLLLIVGLMLCACKSVKYVPTQDSSTTKDSIVYRERFVLKDTPIYIPGEKIIVTIKTPCDSNGFKKGIIASSKNNRGSLTISDQGNGTLKIECEADSLKKVISHLSTVIREKETQQSKADSKTKIQTVEVIEYKVPKWCYWVIVYAIVITIYCFRDKLLTVLKAFITGI